MIYRLFEFILFFVSSEVNIIPMNVGINNYFATYFLSKFSIIIRIFKDDHFILSGFLYGPLSLLPPISKSTTI